MKIRLDGNLEGEDAELFIKAKAEASIRFKHKFNDKSYIEHAVKKYNLLILGIEDNEQ